MGIINFFLCTHEFILDGGLAHSCARWWKYSPPPHTSFPIAYITSTLQTFHQTSFLQAIKVHNISNANKLLLAHSISPTRLGFYFLYELATYTSPYILCSRCCGTTKVVVLCQVTLNIVQSVYLMFLIALHFFCFYTIVNGMLYIDRCPNMFAKTWLEVVNLYMFQFKYLIWWWVSLKASAEKQILYIYIYIWGDFKLPLWVGSKILEFGGKFPKICLCKVPLNLKEKLG